MLKTLSMRATASRLVGTLISCLAAAGSVGACGSEVTGTGGPSAIVGNWRASIEENGTTYSAVWRFYEDGHVDQLVVTEQGGATLTRCRANTIDSHFADRGTKLLIRFGTTNTEYLYEITDGGKRLRLDPGVDLQGQTVNSYEREASVSQDCSYVDAGR